MKETVWALPAFYGTGEFRKTELNDHITITTSHCTLKNNYLARVEQATPMVTFAFAVSGLTTTANASLKNEFSIEEDNSYVHYFPDPVFQRRIRPQKRLQAIVIRIAPEYFRRLFDHDSKHPSQVYKALLSKDQMQPFFHFRQTTAPMRASLYQMVNCPHRGIIKRLFLESKALELIAYKIEQILEPERKNSDRKRLSRREFEQVYHAKDILVKDLQNPPSLPGLAKASGLTHTRLNRGFRTVFGCTVFEYLRREKLELGRLLLCESDMSITEVSFAAGFCSSSHFSHSFLKQFGIQPGEYRNHHST